MDVKLVLPRLSLDKDDPAMCDSRRICETIALRSWQKGVIPSLEKTGGSVSIPRPQNAPGSASLRSI